MDNGFCQEQCEFYRYQADSRNRTTAEYCRYRPDKPMQDIAALTDCPYEQDENIGSYPIEDLIADGIPITDMAFYWQIWQSHAGRLPPELFLFPAWYTDRIAQQIDYQRRRTMAARKITKLKGVNNGRNRKTA